MFHSLLNCSQFVGLYWSSAPAGIQRFFKSGKNSAPAKILPEPDAFAGFGKMHTSNAIQYFVEKSPALVITVCFVYMYSSL